jgi:hypothetical protein
MLRKTKTSSQNSEYYKRDTQKFHTSRTERSLGIKILGESPPSQIEEFPLEKLDDS